MTTGHIWIYGDLRSARHWEKSLNVMAKARPFAQANQTPLVMILMGSRNRSIDVGAANAPVCVTIDMAAEQAAAFGADKSLILTHNALATPRTDIYARVLADQVRQHNPWLVMFPLNDFGRETAAFCAQRRDAGMIADCAEPILQQGAFVGRCPAWGGQIMADITLAEGVSTAFVTVHPHDVERKACGDGEGLREYIALESIDIPDGVHLQHRSMEPAQARRLEDARVVVAGGAGLGDIRGFNQVRELAAALGAEVGATRPPVLNRWVEEDRLIGQTGKSVRPDLLITVGTSGAVQYTAGICEAKTIVAINRDPKAPIFQWADIGLVGDAGVLIPLLVKRAQKAAMRRLADAACALTEKDGQMTAGGFGHVVRRLREARGWTVAHLARITGQQPDFIERVESEKLTPPIRFILGMAQAMQVDPGAFLRKEEQAVIHDRRVQAYHSRTRTCSYTTLTPDAENNHLRAFMITIEPHRAHKPVAYKHEGEEFIFVMEGELELTLGGQARTFRAGESIHFNSDVPHKLKNLSADSTRCLVVLYTL